MDVDKRTLDELISLMQREGLDRLRVAFGDLDLDLRMSLPSANSTTAGSVREVATEISGVPAQQTGTVAPANVRKVLAPLVGVFYRAPAPGAKHFVEMGDEVAAGQVLCILEAMKLMNEIVSEHTGKVVRICVNDGQLVSLHQELFWIET